MLRNFCRVLLPLMLTVLNGCSFGPLMQAGNNSGSQAAKVNAPAGVQREYRKAVGAFQEGDLITAEADLRRFIVKHPEYANAYVNLAILLDNRGDTEGAVDLLQQATAIDADNVFALNRLGLIKRRAGDFSAAEQAWLEATRVHPEYANAWYNLGVLYDLYLQDLTAAVSHYQRYQDLMAKSNSQGAPTDAGVQRWIADLQRRIGDSPQTANATESL